MQQLNLVINHVQLLTGNGADHISLETDLPCSFVPESGITLPLTLEFRATAGYGRKYIESLGLKVDEEINV